MLSLPALLWAKWSVLLLLWLVLAYWYWREYQHFDAAVHKNNSKLAIRLFETARNRSLGLMGVFALMIMGMVYYDLRIEKLEDVSAMPRSITPLSPSDSAIATIQQAAVPPNPVTELYGANTPEQAREEKLDQLKQRYEEAFVTFFYLQRCAKIDGQDFHIINRSLFYELLELNAPPVMQHTILEAARGSYVEMYSQSPCKDETVAALEKQYAIYLLQLNEINSKAEQRLKDSQVK